MKEATTAEAQVDEGAKRTSTSTSSADFERDWHDVRAEGEKMDHVAELEKTIDATVKKLKDLKAFLVEKGNQQHEQGSLYAAMREAKLAHNAVERALLAAAP